MKQLRYINRYIVLFIIGAVINTMFSCSDENSSSKIDPSPQIEKIVDLETALVDYLAIGALDVYYLWIDDTGRKDMIDAYLNPDTCLHPTIVLKKVLSNEDRWTTLLNNFSETVESIDGIETTIGADCTPYLIANSEIVFGVNYVYNNSPAQKAGLKRGDIILDVNGKIYNSTNYKEFYYQKNPMKISLGILDGKTIIKTENTIEITPVKMTLDPIICTSIIDLGTKKVGYLAYDNFTSDTENLKQVFGEFKDNKISEIVLDLRYNGGGLVSTSIALASMLAPIKDVQNESVFHKNIYNTTLTEKVFKDKLDERFDKNYVEYNPNIQKIYALVSSYTASASEGLLVGLNPYVDLTIIGEQTHGKFCSGVLLGPENVFSEDSYNKYKKEFKDWGIYVMIGTFSDKNGKNASRPNGFIPSPDLTIEDNPLDGYQLGDENETMLRKALELAGKTYPKSSTRAEHSNTFMKSLRVERRSLSIDSHSSKLLHKALDPK